MTDPLSRVRAGLARDEAIARKACLMVTMPGSERWRFDAMQVRGDDRNHSLVVKHTWPDEGEHIARHDPSRVLRQSEAIQEVLNIVGRAMEWEERDPNAAYADIVAALASIYPEDTTETGDGE